MRHVIRTVLLLAIAAHPAVAQEAAEPPAQISVSASASVDTEPDRAVVNLAVETLAQTAQEATRENARKMAALLAALRDLGIPEDRVRTVSYGLNPEYRRPRAGEEPGPIEERIVGYRAMNMVRVVVDSVPRVGAVIDAAVAKGGNRVAGLHFEVSDPSQPRREALRRAVAIARGEAQVLAESLDVPLGPPINVSTSYAPPPPMPFAAAARMEMAQDVSTPVQGGTIEVRADVHIVFRIGGR